MGIQAQRCSLGPCSFEVLLECVSIVQRQGDTICYTKEVNMEMYTLNWQSLQFKVSSKWECKMDSFREAASNRINNTPNKGQYSFINPILPNINPTSMLQGFTFSV